MRLSRREGLDIARRIIGDNGSLLTTGNAKIEKTNKGGKYLVAIQHWLPWNSSGWQVCASASKGCIASCLNRSGRTIGDSPATDRILAARRNRTSLFFKHRQVYWIRLCDEIHKLQRKADKLGVGLALRLNGTSDFPFETSPIFKAFPSVQFYDYTKHHKRMFKTLPPNYHLTFSRTESNHAKCLEVLKHGGNVAVVFDRPDKQLPKTWSGYPVINGDLSDLRHLDPTGSVVGLKAKGKARHDQSGFVFRSDWP